MEIVQPYATMLAPSVNLTGMMGGFTIHHGIDLLRRIELIGRVSHRSESKQTDSSWEGFLKAVVMGHGDWSIVEHASVTTDAVVDRGITHEWVRHRIGAYTQESTRFVNYARKHTDTTEYVNPARFICPPSILACKEDADMARRTLYYRWVEGREADENEYIAYVESGIKPQEARTCFPNALASRLVASYNLRMWRHFLIMRTTKEAHPQMKEVTIPLLKQFQENIPLLYDDIVPNEAQRIAMSKPR